MYEDHGKPEGTVWDPSLLPLTIGTTCGTNTPPDVARRLLNIKPSALPRWGEGGAIRSLAVEREGTTSNGVGGVTQYVDNGRVEGCTCMLTCGDASVADGDAENKGKARDLVDLEVEQRNKCAKESRLLVFVFFPSPR